MNEDQKRIVKAEVEKHKSRLEALKKQYENLDKDIQNCQIEMKETKEKIEQLSPGIKRGDKPLSEVMNTKEVKP